jgi:hypothetical protein
MAVQTHCGERDRRRFAEFTALHGTEHGVEFVQLYLTHVEVTQEIA